MGERDCCMLCFRQCLHEICAKHSFASQDYDLHIDLPYCFSVMFGMIFFFRGINQFLFSLYHWTVSLIPLSIEYSGSQSSSFASLEKFIAYLKSWPLRSVTNSTMDSSRSISFSIFLTRS